MTMQLNTDLSEVESSRANVINYARVLFEREQPSAIYAFCQFQDEDDLFHLILAKKKGVFDYGEHIVKDGVIGWTHPHPIEVKNKLVDEMKKQGLRTDNIRAALLALPDVEIKITKDFKKPDQWKDLTDAEKVEKKRQMLTEFYEKNGHRQLQHKHYEIMLTRTKRGETPEAIIDRIANSDWNPFEAREVENVERENAWTRIINKAQNASGNLESNLKVRELETRVNQLEEIVKTFASLEQLQEKHKELLEEINYLKSRSVVAPKEVTETLVKTVEEKVSAPKYREADLILKPLSELKDIATELGIEGADKIMIKQFLIRKILAAA